MLGQQWVTPFRVTDPDRIDADHARPALIQKSDGGRMDLFVASDALHALSLGESREAAQKHGLVTMAYNDCDTIPFLWKYASTFALYDHFFQAMYGPSTPGNIELIAAQTGQTQWARHPQEGDPRSDTGPGVPVVDDLDPAFGPYRQTPKAGEVQDDLTFANVLLTLSGEDARNARADSGDVKEDVASLARARRAAIPWGWYQEGYNGGKPTQSYATHHDSPQYFGYIRNNDYFWRNVHDLHELFPALSAGTLGARSVVFVKGGYANTFGWKPIDPDPAVQKAFAGDDDHPGYSDSQISEAFVATVVDAIARSRYWNDSAIFIIWDDSDGYYDHVPPPQFERCPDGHPCGDGPRVPAILLSPYAKSHAIVPEVSDHASFAKFLATLFDLPPLASLPDEAPYLPEGPRDTEPRLSDLTGGFSAARLAGTQAPIPAAAAQIPDAVVGTLPASMSCRSLGITPARVPGSNAPPNGYASAPRR